MFYEKHDTDYDVTHLSPASMDCIQSPAFLIWGKLLSPYLDRETQTIVLTYIQMNRNSVSRFNAGFGV